MRRRDGDTRLVGRNPELASIATGWEGGVEIVGASGDKRSVLFTREPNGTRGFPANLIGNAGRRRDPARVDPGLLPCSPPGNRLSIARIADVQGGAEGDVAQSTETAPRDCVGPSARPLRARDSRQALQSLRGAARAFRQIGNGRPNRAPSDRGRPSPTRPGPGALLDLA